MEHRGRWLWAGALVAIGAALASAQTARKMVHKTLRPSELSWRKPPPGLPPSTEAALLDGNPTEPGLFFMRLRLPDGTQLRPHWHSIDEHITILSGRLAVGMGETWSTQNLTDLPPGSYASMPALQRHFALARGETIVQLTGSGPFDIHYVDPADDPRQQRSSR
jgi:hypothetical protein